MRKKHVIGRKTTIDFVDLEMGKVEAKVDTGAYHNAIHAKNVEIIDTGKRKYLSFQVVGDEKVNHISDTITVKDYSKTRVRSSIGIAQRRYVVQLRIRVPNQNKIYRTNFTLANRSKMKTPVLLGRRFLKDRFIVDVSS